MKTSRKLMTKGVVTTMLTLGMMFTLAVFMPGSGLILMCFERYET